MSGRQAQTPSPAEPAFFQAILEHAVDLFVVVDADGRMVYTSQSALAVLGHDPADRLGASVYDFVHPDDVAEQQAQRTRVLEAPGKVVSGEFRAQHRDGSWRVLEGTAQNLLDEPRIKGILVTLRDVTELRRAESELRRARALLKEVVDHAPVVLWKVDADGVFQLSEGRGLEGLGLRPGEVVGRNLFDVYADAAETVDSMQRALGGEAVEERLLVGDRVFDSRMRPTVVDGEVVGAVGMAVDVTDAAREAERSAFQARLLENVGQAVMATDPEGRVIYWNAAAEGLYGWSRREALGSYIGAVTIPEDEREAADTVLATVRSGDTWEAEQTHQRKDGTHFPAHVSYVPILEDGVLAAMIGVSVDLTEQKRLESQLAWAQKMEAVGQLAGGIAHDFNNLLTAIGGYAALASNRTDDPGVVTDLQEVMEATERARGLASKLLAFARPESGRAEPFDLNATLRRMQPLIRRLAGEDVRLVMELTDRPWPVVADPGLIEQAIVNLVVNAGDAMPGGGTLTVATTRVSLDEQRVRELELQVDSGDYMRVAVEDTGQGIAPEVRDRIFEPFFTTKGVGKGTGLGLSLVFGSVRQAGGDVRVESEPGEGTRIVFYLPRTEPAESPSRSRSSAEPGENAVRTILVVEDEVAVLSLARRVLEKDGFRVLTAESAEAALEELEREHADLVLSDVIMPHTSGPELIQELRNRDPGLRTVFMSGYTADELEARGLDRNEENFLPKPFTPRELLEAVQTALAD